MTDSRGRKVRKAAGVSVLRLEEGRPPSTVFVNFRATANLCMPHSTVVLAGPKFNLLLLWLNWNAGLGNNSETGKAG